jgi:adenylate kinase
MSRIGEPAKELIFFGGVHGVGKTTLCRALAEQMDAVHVSAGSLLRVAGFVEPTQYTVLNPRRNQTYIQAALQDYREQHCDARIVLDGHFCLLTSHNRIQVLPCALFESLKAMALLVVVDNPSAISQRLADRDGTCLDAILVDRLQRREEARARAISRHLGLPFRKITPSVPVADVLQWILDLG